jgi:diguanylate cyclase (GGDEF)-like protein/PAS domain S-box-containing protein
MPIFLFQTFFVYENFNYSHVFAPFVVAFILGSLIGKIRILNADIKKREKLFHAIANEAKEFSYFKALDGKYIYVSPSSCSLTGYNKSDFLANKDFFSTLIIDEDKAIWEEHRDTIQKSANHHEIEFRIKTKHRDIVWVNHNCSTVYEHGKAIGYRSVNTNITQRKLDESRITHMATHDSLTTLPNRKAIFEALERLIIENSAFTTLFIDLNRFKKINDTFGHKIGDEILIKVTQKLQSTLKETFIGRLGGDEFIIILEDISQKRDIQPIINKLLNEIESDYFIENLTLYIGLSIGVASFPYDAVDKQELLACADKAMYKAKTSANSSYFYCKDLPKDDLDDNFILEKDLRSALKERKLSVHFQPKIDITKDRIHSFEALIRWEDGDKFISPLKFIPLAEKTGLIKHITYFVINEVFAIAKVWQKEGNCHKFSINVSVIDFMSDHLIEYIQEALLRYDVQASWFEIEMTESLFLEETESIKKRLHQLINMGFNIALDDFGKGYSSLSYLTKFPIKTLKIDKSFIENLEHNYKKNYPLLKSIVTLAKELDLEIVAEGVETQKEHDILSSLGCQIIQGHYYAKALPLELLDELHHEAPSQLSKGL